MRFIVEAMGRSDTDRAQKTELQHFCHDESHLAFSASLNFQCPTSLNVDVGWRVAKDDVALALQTVQHLASPLKSIK